MVEFGIGSVKDIILYWENDYELYKSACYLMQSMVKKEAREKKKNPEFELLREQLQYSSTIATMARETLRKYSAKVETLKVTKTLRDAVRKAMTDHIFDKLDYYRN